MQDEPKGAGDSNTRWGVAALLEQDDRLEPGPDDAGRSNSTVRRAAWNLASQLGNADYSRPGEFRERLEPWLDLVRVLWPACPAQINSDGEYMLIQPAIALAAKGA